MELLLSCTCLSKRGATLVHLVVDTVVVIIVVVPTAAVVGFTITAADKAAHAGDVGVDVNAVMDPVADVDAAAAATDVGSSEP